MWNAVEELRKEGITVLLTTHYMEEADSLSDRVAIIDYGRVLALGSPEKLKATLRRADHLRFETQVACRD